MSDHLVAGFFTSLPPTGTSAARACQSCLVVTGKAFDLAFTATVMPS